MNIIMAKVSSFRKYMNLIRVLMNPNHLNSYSSVPIDLSKLKRSDLAKGSLGFCQAIVEERVNVSDYELVSILKEFTENETVEQFPSFKLGKYDPKSVAKVHYDLPAGFYDLFLGNSFVYTSGLHKKFSKAIKNMKKHIFIDNMYSRVDFLEIEKMNINLDEMQQHKLDYFVNELQKNGVKKGRILDIGSGYGSLAIELAKKGYEVVGISISEEGHNSKARERIKKEKLKNVEILNRDIFDPLLFDKKKGIGKFDAVVSVEMIEAIGNDKVVEFFSIISKLLKPKGVSVIQSIMLSQKFKDNDEIKNDYINEYIFPGGEVIKFKELYKGIDENKFNILSCTEIGDSYVLTLYAWLCNLRKNKSKILKLKGLKNWKSGDGKYSGPKEFFKVFETYLLICVITFYVGNTTDIITTIRKK